MDCFASSMIAWKLSERLYKMNVVGRCFQMHCDVTRRSLWLRMIHQLWIFPRTESILRSEQSILRTTCERRLFHETTFFFWFGVGSPGIWVTQCFTSKIIAVLLQVLKWLYMVLLHRHTACVGNISAVSFSFKDKESKVFETRIARVSGTRTKTHKINKKPERFEVSNGSLNLLLR